MDCNKLFSEVKFFMAQCNRHDEIKDLLIDGGARHINYLSEQVTHVIADSNCPEAEEAVELYDKPVVTSLWVHLCISAKRVLPAEAFSPNRRTFQNVIAAFSSDLSKADIDVLAATLTFYGGRLTKDLEQATHFIATTTKPSEFQDNGPAPYQFKMIAPDWILESVKQNSCLEESLFDPSLLLGPPPPPPPKQPTPPPVVRTEDVSKSDTRNGEHANNRPNVVPSSNENSERDLAVLPQNQNLSPLSQQRFPKHPQSQMNPNQQPRMRMATNVPRGAQPRFRQILPPNANLPQSPRQQVQPQPRLVMTDAQQPRKVAGDYNNAYRKAGPYPTGPEMQHMQPHQQPIQTYQQTQHPPMHQQGPPLNQPNRLPQPNVYQQTRMPYQNNQMPPRMNMAQPNMMNQQPMQNQPMNRFQEPSNQMPQPRPYQVGIQHQAVNSSYQQGSPQRQPMYYNQNQNMPMRMPQQGPPPRMMMQSDHMPHDSYPQAPETIQPHPQYQNAAQQAYQPHSRLQVPQQQQQQHPQPQQHPQQPQQQPQHQLRAQQFQQPHPPMVGHPRAQFTPTMPGNIRGPRSQSFNPQEMKTNIRQQVEKPPRAPRAQIIQTQPHPSIFDPKQESSYAQMKAKVPILTDNIEYYDHNPGLTVPKYQPFTNCSLKLVEHTSINPKLVKKWTDAIVDAGGRFTDNMDEITHIICESRSTPTYSEAMQKGIRCVTIYWVNDVLAEDKMTYPWKALHIPTPFMQDDKPLQNQIISITNFRGRERREVKEMIMKTGAKCTDYFSQSNTLLICGSPGGEKYERAIEWSIPIANCQLLSDFLISGRDFSQMLAHAKYQNFNHGDQLRLDSYVLIRDLMQPWTKPVSLLSIKNAENSNQTNGISKGDSVIHTNEDSGLATGGSNNSDTDVVKSQLDGPKEPNMDSELGKGCETTAAVTGALKDVLPASTVHSNDISSNIDLTAPIETEDVDMKIIDTSDQKKTDQAEASICQKDSNPVETAAVSDIIATSSSDLDKQETASAITEVELAKKAVRTSNEPVRIMFTHLEAKLVRQLESHAKDLGLYLARSPVECTHLVVDQLSRTPKFICAFSHARYILSYKWLIESHETGQVLDEKAFILQDSEGESKFSFNLVYSLLKRRRRKGLLFTNFIFFVTPTVLARVKNLKEMIESAGGKITTRKLPTIAQLNQIRTSGKRFVIITSHQDLHLCSSAEQIGVDLLQVEFVISGILRQDIDIEAHRISLTQPVKKAIEAHPSNSIVAPSPNKRPRAE